MVNFSFEPVSMDFASSIKGRPAIRPIRLSENRNILHVDLIFNLNFNISRLLAG